MRRATLFLFLILCQDLLATASLQVDAQSNTKFANLTLGQEVERQLIIINTGDLPATALHSYTSGTINFAVFKKGALADEKEANLYPGKGGTCGSVLAPKETCTVVISFAAIQYGKGDAYLPINYFDGSTNLTLHMKLGYEIQEPARLELSQAETFVNSKPGGVGKIMVEVKNIGGTTARKIHPIHIPIPPFGFLGAEYPGDGGTCKDTLEEKKSCRMYFSVVPPFDGEYSSPIELGYESSGKKFSNRLELTYVSAPHVSRRTD